MHGVVLPAGVLPAGAAAGSLVRAEKLHVAAAQSAFYRRDGAVLCASYGDQLHSPGSSIRSEGNQKGRPRRNVPLDKNAIEFGKFKATQPTMEGKKQKPSNQGEIMALFRRIQASISKGGGPIVSKKRSPSKTKEKQSAAAIIGALQRQPPKKQAKDMVLPKELQVKEGIPAIEVSKVARPASNFVKRSPIPQLSSKKEITEELPKEQLLPVVIKEEFERLEMDQMKLSELKELAKTKGIRGYSKLKKGELLELLKSL